MGLTQQEDFDNFVAEHGGRTKFHELIEETVNTPAGMFAFELNALIKRNAFARSRIADVFRAIKNCGQFGEEVRQQFQGTPATHSDSTADDFYKAKSEEYLRNAEFTHAMDEACLNNDEGWPDSGKDIGEK
jgi:hypothetical protein